MLAEKKFVALQFTFHQWVDLDAGQLKLDRLLYKWQVVFSVTVIKLIYDRMVLKDIVLHLRILIDQIVNVI